MTASTPDHVAILAAANFEAMPPLPTADPGPPAMRSSSWSISTTSSISDASTARRGSSVKSPAVSVSSTNWSAPTRWATRAARRSLSPNRISSSATASFSLTTGTTPRSSSRANVRRAWRYWLRWMKSNGASRTWPARSPTAARASLHTRIRRCWPTAATACSVTGSDGRGAPGDSAVHPAAMAPDVTTTTRCPSLRSPATSPESPPMADASTVPSSRVTEDDPILTTTVRGPGEPIVATPPALTVAASGGSTADR